MSDPYLSTFLKLINDEDSISDYNKIICKKCRHAKVQYHVIFSAGIYMCDSCNSTCLVPKKSHHASPQKAPQKSHHTSPQKVKSKTTAAASQYQSPYLIKTPRLI